MNPDSSLAAASQTNLTQLQHVAINKRSQSHSTELNDYRRHDVDILSQDGIGDENECGHR
jgi:hypothetical protein